MNDLSFAHISLLTEICSFAVTPRRARASPLSAVRRIGVASGGSAYFANLPTSLIVKRETCLWIKF